MSFCAFLAITGRFPRLLLLGMGLISLNVPGIPQTPDTLMEPGYRVVVAGKQYKRNSLHQFLWGKHYRKDWTTPVKVRIINLDTVNGGLTAYEKGGGRQTKTLRLRNAAGKEYVLRSIDKSFGKALPDIYRGMFIEDIIDDQASIAQPYAAITISGMAEAARIYHTKPVIVYVPAQKALGEFSDDFGNDLYLFEQRPDENWEEAANFANSKKIVGTEKMLENIFEDNDNRADQLGFVRARLFDMFIGDWGRHEDQWRWAEIEDGDKKIYKPIPRDRDQVYTLFDGVMLKLAISAAGVDHLESFGTDIKNVASYNFPARNLDRQIANEPSKEQWLKIAEELKLLLTDAVIEASVRELPPEVFSNSGQAIITKLKARRDRLSEFASEYYMFLAKEVEIVGTHDSEYFQIRSLSGNETEVNVFDLNKEGKPKKNPFYSRKFKSDETREIRIYGLSGNDQYEIENNTGSIIKTRIIGGPGNDTYISKSASDRVSIYDNSENDFSNLTGSKKRLSDNPFIHLYTYNGFNYDKKGMGVILSYNTEDHIHAGLKYTIEKQQWRKYPFGHRQEFAARYSISERAFSFGYEGIFTELIGKWNLHLDAQYDFVRRTNFFGIGNETKMVTTDRPYHRVRSKVFYAGVGLERTLYHYHHAAITAFYQTIEVLNDPGIFLTEQTPKYLAFSPTHFGGVKLDYYYQKLDDVVVPMKGFRFGANINFTQNLEQPDSAVTNYSAVMNIYIPLSKSFVIALKTGGATITGKPEFYQLNKLSGSKTLRGFRKYRFYGRSMFYNQAELQFIRPVKSYLFSGKAGLIGLYDIGRVWQPGEISTTWHYGYGGGVMLAPFNKFSISFFYGFSRSERDYSVRLTKGL